MLVSVSVCDVMRLHSYVGHGIVYSDRFLWPPYGIGQSIIFLPCGFFLSFLFFFSPNLSSRRLDVYHTWTHGVALVRIWNAGLKCAACGSLEIQFAKNGHLGTIAQLCHAVSSQLRHVSTIGKKFVKQQYLLHMSSQYGELRSN